MAALIKDVDTETVLGLGIGRRTARETQSMKESGYCNCRRETMVCVELETRNMMESCCRKENRSKKDLMDDRLAGRVRGY